MNPLEGAPALVTTLAARVMELEELVHDLVTENERLMRELAEAEARMDEPTYIDGIPF